MKSNKIINIILKCQTRRKKDCEASSIMLSDCRHIRHSKDESIISCFKTLVCEVSLTSPARNISSTTEYTYYYKARYVKNLI